MVLSRRIYESVIIGTNITVEVVDIRGDHVRLGISAPPEIEIDRREVRNRKDQDRKRREQQGAV